MDGATLRPKVTVAKLTPRYNNNTSPATSRPSSRNSSRSTSRPPSPTKSFVSASSPLVTRPKAKVNSSAIRRTPSSNTAQPDNPANSNRPPSPVKFNTTPRIRDGALSPPGSSLGVGTRKTTVVRVKPSASVSSVVSTTKSPSPELRNRSLTASSDRIRVKADPRKRQGSAAAVLHHAASSSSLKAPSPSPSPSPLIRAGPRVSQNEIGNSSTDTGQEYITVSAPQPTRIRSKVTVIAKNLNDISTTPTPNASATVTMPTTNNTNRPMTTRVRAGSTSSNISSMNIMSTSPPPSTPPTSAPIFYPITTATSAANPHRYAATRSSPAGLRTTFSSPSSPKYMSTPGTQDDLRPFAKSSIFPYPSPNLNINGYSVGSARVSIDPVNVPLPPHSPPISSLSVSTRSSASVSRSSVSYIHEPGTSPESYVSLNLKRSSGSPQSLRNTLDTLVAYSSARDDGDDDDNDTDNDDKEFGGGAEEDKERKVKNEAKSNRKIADLEITNRSLLAINTSLEKTKDRQAKEIRELKRKLRESRLTLPPPAYRALKSSMGPEEIGDDEEDIDSATEDSDSDSGEIGGAGGGKTDETYTRIKVLINNLLDSGRKALEETKEDYMHAKGIAKVLTAEEVESWRGSTRGGGDIDDIDDDNDYRSHLNSHSPTPEPTMRGSVVGLGLGNSNHSSPPNPSSAMSSPKPPPILITGSP